MTASGQPPASSSPDPKLGSGTGIRTLHVGLKPGYRSDSVISLVYQDPHPDLSALGRVGISACDFSLSSAAAQRERARYENREPAGVPSQLRAARN